MEDSVGYAFVPAAMAMRKDYDVHEAVMLVGGGWWVVVVAAVGSRGGILRDFAAENASTRT